MNNPLVVLFFRTWDEIFRAGSVSDDTSMPLIKNNTISINSMTYAIRSRTRLNRDDTYTITRINSKVGITIVVVN